MHPVEILEPFKKDTYDLWSTRNVQVFSDFTGNSRAQKPNKAQTKQTNTTGINYFRAYQQGVSTSSITGILYPLFVTYPNYLS